MYRQPETWLLAVNGTKFNSPFNVTATFSDTSGTCAAGEYRQSVKGTFTVSGTVLDHVLCGPVKLAPDVFHEDGCPSGSCTAYGHRSCPQDPIDQYLPQRNNGCEFKMYDAPGFNNISKGNTYNLDLTFEGTLINVTAGNAVLVTKSWTTSGSKQILETRATTATVGLQSTDRIVGAHLTRGDARYIAGQRKPEHITVGRKSLDARIRYAPAGAPPGVTVPKANSTPGWYKSPSCCAAARSNSSRLKAEGRQLLLSALEWRRPLMPDVSPEGRRRDPLPKNHMMVSRPRLRIHGSASLRAQGQRMKSRRLPSRRDEALPFFHLQRHLAPIHRHFDPDRRDVRRTERIDKAGRGAGAAADFMNDRAIDGLARWPAASTITTVSAAALSGRRSVGRAITTCKSDAPDTELPPAATFMARTQRHVQRRAGDHQILRQ